MANLNGKILTPLIDFDFIVDTDMGLIRFIRQRFQDPRAFKLDIVNKSDREILSLLYSREHINPLSIISTENNMSDIDCLYDSFMKEYKREIIAMSISQKPINNFVGGMLANGINIGVNGYICIKDDLEESEIRTHFNCNNFVRSDDKQSISVKDPFYVKDYSFFIKNGATNIFKKKIYTSPRQYNINYFEQVENEITKNNVPVLMGKDFRIKGENDNGHT